MSRLIVLLLLAGCWPRIPGPYADQVGDTAVDDTDTDDLWSDTDTTDPDTDTTDPDTDTTDPDTDTTDPDTGIAFEGGVAFIHYAPDPKYDESTLATGLFADDVGDLYNPGGCVSFGLHCQASWPAAGAPAQETPHVSNVPRTSDFIIHIADTLSVAGESVDLSTGSPWHYGWLPNHVADTDTVSAAMTDAELGSWSHATAVEMPDPLEVSSPDPGASLTRTPSGTLELAWAGGGEGTVRLALQSGRDTAYLLTLSDTGSYTLDLAEYELALDTELILTLFRQTRRIRSAGEGSIVVTAHEEQWLYLTVTEE